MKAVPFCSVLVLATLLAGCASVQEPEPEPGAAVAAADQAGPSQDAITGSRIPSRRTEKMVSQVGGKDYKDNKQALPAPLRSN
jgi:hypothetical protein